ncbi:MAG TPA: hypothetical protein DCZ12_14710 [Gammaproteobacteria bacterium]|nr:hypothetical protein [Gammaproteobacteria bacterium]
MVKKQALQKSTPICQKLDCLTSHIALATKKHHPLVSGALGSTDFGENTSHFGSPAVKNKARADANSSTAMRKADSHFSRLGIKGALFYQA